MNAQNQALKLRFAPGLLLPGSGLNPSVRIGELARHILSHWSIQPLPPKPDSKIRYLTICGRSHWMMLRESLFSLYHAWHMLPQILIVSDGSWTKDELQPVFDWWPGAIEVLTRQEIETATRNRGEEELAQYASASPYGLKLAAIVQMALQNQPLFFVDADILWFQDPGELIGSGEAWRRPRGVRESHCYQRPELALRYCPQVLEPPFVNGGILALKGEFLDPLLLREMVKEALVNPMEGSYEQTIIATAVHKGEGIFPSKLSLVEFNDVETIRYRDMREEGYYSRHYVNWMRHLLYRDAFSIRWRALWNS